MRHAERAERIAHDAGVVGVEQARERRVAPRASAASSNVRLEMLFEPGSRSVPCAPGSRAEGRGDPRYSLDEPRRGAGPHAWRALRAPRP